MHYDCEIYDRDAWASALLGTVLGISTNTDMKSSSAPAWRYPPQARGFTSVSYQLSDTGPQDLSTGSDAESRLPTWKRRALADAAPNAEVYAPIQDEAEITASEAQQPERAIDRPLVDPQMVRLDEPTTEGGSRVEDLPNATIRPVQSDAATAGV